MHIFTRISVIACENKVCWNLVCTTCDGKRQIRDAIRKNMKLEAQRQKIENFEMYYTINIGELINYSCFPDWLGHLGIMLDLTKDYQGGFNNKLTKSLATQFMELFSPEDEIYGRLENKIKNNEILNWEELKKIEAAYLKKYIILKYDNQKGLYFYDNY